MRNWFRKRKWDLDDHGELHKEGEELEEKSELTISTTQQAGSTTQQADSITQQTKEGGKDAVTMAKEAAVKINAMLATKEQVGPVTEHMKKFNVMMDFRDSPIITTDINDDYEAKTTEAKTTEAKQMGSSIAETLGLTEVENEKVNLPSSLYSHSHSVILKVKYGGRIQTDHWH